MRAMMRWRVTTLWTPGGLAPTHTRSVSRVVRRRMWSPLLGLISVETLAYLFTLFEAGQMIYALWGCIAGTSL